MSLSAYSTLAGVGGAFCFGVGDFLFAGATEILSCVTSWLPSPSSLPGGVDDNCAIGFCLTHGPQLAATEAGAAAVDPDNGCACGSCFGGGLAPVGTTVEMCLLRSSFNTLLFSAIVDSLVTIVLHFDDVTFLVAFCS